MPFTLARSILVLLIPGLVALAPWVLLIATRLENFSGLYKSHAPLINAALIGVAVIIGSLIEGSLSYLVVKWDKEREGEYQVRENWFAYLAQQCSFEPVGFRYISRMFTAMYFELSMMVAAPMSLVGISFLAYSFSQSRKELWAGTFLMLAISMAWFLHKEAKVTRRVLSDVRQELNTRLSNSRPQ